MDKLASSPIGENEGVRVTVTIQPIENGFEVRGNGNQNLRFSNTGKDQYSGIRHEYANGYVCYAFPTLAEALAGVEKAMEEARILTEKDAARVTALMDQTEKEAA